MTGVTSPLSLHKRGLLVYPVTACPALYRQSPTAPLFTFSAQGLSQLSVEKRKIQTAPATQGTNVKVLISPKMPLKPHTENGMAEAVVHTVVRMVPSSKDSDEPGICIKENIC